MSRSKIHLMGDKFDLKEIVECYQRLLDDCVGDSPLKIDDLETILQTGNYFILRVRGSSARERLNERLQHLRTEIELRHPSPNDDELDVALSKLLTQRLEALRSNDSKRAEVRHTQRRASVDKPDGVSDDVWGCLEPFLTALEARPELCFRRFHAYLFGSCARSHARAGSDLDVAIVSAEFNGMSWERRIALLKLGTPRLECLINAVGLTPEELESFEYPTIIRSIRDEGKEIW